MKAQVVSLVLTTLTLARATAQATEFNVANPAEVRKAIKAVHPGDTILLTDGTWRDVTIEIEANGAPDQPITLRAHHPGRTFLTGQSRIRLGGSHLVVDGLCFKDGHAEGGHVVAFRTDDDKPARHCRLTNTAFIDYNPPSREAHSYWVSLYGVSNRVDHCRFEGKNDGSPTLTVWVDDPPNYHRIDHNQFLRRPPLGRNGGETIRVGDSKHSMQNSRTLVEDNYFHDCSGESEIISNKSCENVYRHNTFVECQGALVLRHGNRCRVEANWFLGHHRSDTGGIRIIGEDHRVINNYLDSLAGTDFVSAMPVVNGIPNSKLNEYFQVKRAVVAFNTLVNCRQSITLGAGVGERNRSEPPLDCLFANNLIVSSHSPLIRVEDEPLGLRWEGNLWHGARLGLPATEGLGECDPLLVRDADDIWHPARESPVIDAACGVFPEVFEDILGRPRGHQKDVGCSEFGAGGPRHPRVGPAETGPCWN